MKLLSEVMPSVVDGLQTIHSLCFAKRRPFMAQLVRKDSPIHKEEEAPTLLSEDLATISFQSYIIAGLDPDFRPNESDIKGHLEHAVSEGFSTKRAESILAAWNEGKERWIKSST
jgi:hypothetical protein